MRCSSMCTEVQHRLRVPEYCTYMYSGTRLNLLLFVFNLVAPLLLTFRAVGGSDVTDPVTDATCDLV